MGLFGKNRHIDIEFEESIGSTDDNTVTNFMKQNDYKSPSATAYGIQDAIKLMRKLPNVNTDIVISVVIKTLESANIQVEEIISDAQQREARIEDRSVKLITEIDELEAQIAKLNSEITQLNSDLEETSKVKTLLLKSMELEPGSKGKSKSSDIDEKLELSKDNDVPEELNLA